MRCPVHLALLLILCHCFFDLSASTPSKQLHFRHISVDDGLPSSKVYYLWQDNNKFIWIGTQQGVSKFNGHDFQTFKIQDGLVNNAVWGLTEAPPGYMRFTTHDQIVAGYNGDSIQHFTLAREKGLGQITHFAWLKEDSSLWFAGYEGLFRQKDGEITHFNHTNSPILKKENRCDKIRAIHNSIWIANYNQVLRWNNDTFQVVWKKDKKNGAPSIPQIEKTKNKSFLIHEHKFHTIENDTIVYQGRTKDHFEIRKILYVDGQYWLFSKQAAIRIYDQEMNLEAKVTGFSDKTITDVLQDHESNVWIATLYNGLYMLDQQSRKARVINKNNGLINQHLTFIKGREDSTLCMGSNVSSISFLRNGHIIQNKIPFKKNAINQAVQDAHALPDDAWLIATDFGLYYQPSISSSPIRIQTSNTKQNHVWQNVQRNESKGPLMAIKTICKGTRDKSYLIGNYKGIYELRITSDHGNKKWQIRKLVHGRARAVNTYRDTIWAGSHKGLKQYVADTGGLQLVAEHLTNKKINDLQIASNGNVWVATDGYGVKYYNSAKWQDVSEATNETPQKLHIDDNDFVWVATNNGLKKISQASVKSSERNKIHTYRHFLPTDNVNDIYSFSGHLWVATKKGAIAIDKNVIRNKTKQNITVYIKDVKVQRKSVNLSDKLSIPYHRNSITISYAGLSFKRPDALEYRYKIKPKNKWFYTNDDFIHFSSLEPGEYKFIVEARLKNGSWSQLPATYSFKISPPFYQKPLFLGGASFGGLGIATMLILLRFQQVKRREKQKAYYERKLAEFELRAIENQMNPHFIYNVLNSIQSLILNQRFKDTNAYISRFGKLLRQVLESSKKEMTTLQSEIDLLGNYLELESLRFQGNFSYSIYIDGGIDPLNLQIPPFFIQPFVENSLKHAFHEIDQLAQIHINIYRDDKGLICEVIDNGKGLYNTSTDTKDGLSLTKMSSYGISLIKEKSDILKKTKGLNVEIEFTDLHEDHNHQKGTKVEIRFPYMPFA